MPEGQYKARQAAGSGIVLVWINLALEALQYVTISFLNSQLWRHAVTLDIFIYGGKKVHF